MPVRPRYADVAATLALFAALGGTTYAAVKLGPNAVHTANIAPNAVTSAKVKNHSLLRADFRAGQLPAGLQGTAGPAGPRGDAGASGPKGDTGAKGDAGQTGSPGAAGPGSLEVTALGTTQPSLNGGCVSSGSVTIDAPSAGTVVVRADVQALLNHTTATLDLATFLVGDSPLDCGTDNSGQQAIWTLPAGLPTASNWRNELSVSRTFSVAAGSHTYDAGGFMSSGADAGDQITATQLVAVFYPG